MKRSALLFLTVLLTALAPPVAPPVAAHGGGTPRLVNAPVGPYVVTVWSTPDRPLQGNNVHFSVAVAEADVAADGRPAPGGPVLDADVRLRLRSPGGREAIIPATLAEAGGELYYESDTVVDGEGAWEVVVAVQGPDGDGEAAFGLTVVAATPGGWYYIAGAAVVVALAGWLISRGERASAPAVQRPERAS